MNTAAKVILSSLALIALLTALISCMGKPARQTGTASDVSGSPAGDPTGDPDIIAGGFTPAESPVITDSVRKLVEKAASGLTGAGYDPVAYVASQVVAGTNHLILCTVAPTAPGAEAHYALVTVYEDLEGGASIIEVLESDTECPIRDDPDGAVISGGFHAPETPVITERVKEALTNAQRGSDGDKYEPVAVLAEQMVAGTNYILLCRVVPSGDDPLHEYRIVTLYAGFGNDTEITGVAGFKG